MTTIIHTAISGRAARREPGIRMQAVRAWLDSGLAASRRPGMTGR